MERDRIKGRILKNTPCKEDLYEEQPHKKIAEAIADDLAVGKNTSFIGLDGVWGVGKSNLINIVESILKTDKKSNYHFFTYDSWKHQTDSPRRTILEEMTSELIDSGILTNNDWNEKLENLLAKRKRVNTTTIPSLGIGSIVSLLALIFTPLLYHIAELSNNNIASLCILSLPYIVVYAATIYKTYLQTKKQEKGYKEKISITKVLSNFFLIYKDEIKEDTTYETISEKEPTSSQFRQWFSDISKSLTKGKNILVIVIDNMDRLPKKNVRELWAVILSFFSEEEFPNIRIIVPFDRAHLRSAFETENANGEGSEAINYAEDFINKTFSIIYSVPLPIMTGWMQYFSDRWKEAFGNDAEPDSSLLQIFDLLGGDPTPRKIIAFINQFVTTRNNCDPSIEDKYIALYILGQNKIMENPLGEILKPSYLEGLSFLYEGDERLQECISSLHYQLPIKRAMDVIYTRKITQELNDNKTETLDILKGSKKYGMILTHSIGNIVNIENATLALEKSLKDNDFNYSSHIWEVLYKKIRSSNPQDDAYKDYHSIVMAHIIDKGGYFAFLLEQYHQHMEKDFNVVNYIDGIDRLRRYIDNNGSDLIKEYDTQVSPEQYRTLLDKRGENAGDYGITVDDKNFDTYLSRLPEEELASIDIYPYIKDKMNIPQYENKVKELIKTRYNEIPLINQLMDRLKEIEHHPFDILKYWDVSKIITLVGKIHKGDKLFPDILAMTIATWDKTSTYTQLKNSLSTYLNSNDEELVKKVASVIECYMDYGALLLCLSKHKERKFVLSVARELTIEARGVSLMDIKKVLSNYDKIVSELGMTTELLNRLCNCDLSRITIEDIKSFPIPLFEDLQEVDNTLSHHCLGLAKTFLQSITQEEWRKSLISTGRNFNFELLKVYRPIQLPLCLDAFKELMRDYAIGNSSVLIPKANVDAIIDIYSNNKKSIHSIFVEIRDIFISNSNITKEKLKYLGHWLLEYGKLEYKKDSLEKIFRSEFLDDEEIIKLILNNENVVIKIVRKSDNPIDFRSKIATLLETTHKSDDRLQKLYDKLKG